MPENKRLKINYKVHCSVATCLSSGRVVNNHIKKKFIAVSAIAKLLKSVNIWQRYKQERGCLVYFLCLLVHVVCLPGAQSARDNHVLACNFAKYSHILIFFH